MRKLLLALLPLALAGCWTGPDFYAGVPSVQPVVPGVYRVTRVEAMWHDERERLINEPIGSRLRISYLPDGGVRMESNREFPKAGSTRIVPLDPANGLYVVQVDPGQGAVELGRSVYGLLLVVPGGYRISVPLCDGTRRLAPGSPVVVRGVLFGLRCVYADRASFETAMRAIATDPPSWTEYRRIGD